MNQPVRPGSNRDTASTKRGKSHVAASRVNKTRSNKGFSLGIVGRFFAAFFRMVALAVRVSVVVLIVGAMGFGSYKALPYLNPDIQQIAITGELVRIERQSLTKTVDDNLVGGIVTLDMAYLRSELLAIPWIKNVELIKHFPNTLEVRVYEEQALAQWNDLGYISIEGEFIRSSLYEDLQHLPQLSSARVGGAMENSSFESTTNEQLARVAMGLYHSLNSVVLAEGQKIQTLNESNARGWSMTWDNGLSIDLGRTDHLMRTRHAMATWRRLPLEVKEKLDRIDARYDNGVAIRTSRSTQSVGSARNAEDVFPGVSTLKQDIDDPA